jgi:hypothetical protein
LFSERLYLLLKKKPASNRCGYGYACYGGEGDNGADAFHGYPTFVFAADLSSLRAFHKYALKERLRQAKKLLKGAKWFTLQ